MLISPAPLPKPIPLSPVANRLITHPLLRAAVTDHAELFVAPALITPAACAELIRLTDADSHPSTVADPNGDGAFRTSETSNLCDANPVVEFIRQAFAALTGLSLTNAEPLQGQRYAPGQEFKTHCDWFRPDSADYARFCAAAGQRTWTVMAYLDEVEEGGETVFPHLGLSLTPRAGTAVLWNNLHLDGRGNTATAHHARPVVRGVKHVITQWFRELPWG